EVAKVVGNRVTAIRRGEAAILVRYEGNYTSSRAVVMGDRSGFVFKPMPEWNFIDGHVNAKLARMQILPSELCTDAEFVRRLYIDLTGVPPTVAQARSFVEDAAPSREKRQRLIDELVGGRDYVAYWSNKWADLLQCNTKKLGDKGVWVFRDWIRRSIALNKPYDRFARELITASGGSHSNPATGYLLSLGKDVSKVNNRLTVNLNKVDTGKITEDVSQTFLGVRFNCNRCHDHPFERWTQTQYYEFGAFFARVKFKKGQGSDDVVVYTTDQGGEINHPKTSMVMNPKVPYGQDPNLKGPAQRRDAFAGWLTSAENPLFARSYVNRIWSYFHGIGIIDPVDDIRASNPASNPKLLEALTEDFVRSGFDSQRLMRNIVSSRTYQLSIKTNDWNHDDRTNFSHCIPRRLSAEQLRDTVAQVTGTTLRVPGLPPGMRSVYSPDGMVKGDDFLRLFGRPKRESACECERTSNVSLAHALNLVNGPIISGAVVDSSNGIARLVQQEKDNRKVIENLYYAIFSRPPSDAEVGAVDLGEGPQRLEVAQDLAWALLNSPAFLFNR
ncbi:MAG: DUF1549 and DUF1553 domain-containing protein, partial [Phycisphaerae bacterium]|nr:DUF1549 and DUF1553 domain-containing protein [Phycisphaerae bacterium]